LQERIHAQEASADSGETATQGATHSGKEEKEVIEEGAVFQRRMGVALLPLPAPRWKTCSGQRLRFTRILRFW
jgi:hypothetical protein